MSAYMKIDGLDGNVTAKGLEKTIEVISTNFSVKRNMTTKPGAVMDREGTKPSVSDISITKEVDKTSPKLFGYATVGTVIPSVTISWMNTGKDLSEFHSISMKDVLVSGYELIHDATNPDGTVSKPVEKISFNCTQLEVKNTPHSEDHKAASPVAIGYNLKTAQAA
jgi:type VI secretion system secreted protein Hcp